MVSGGGGGGGGAVGREVVGRVEEEPRLVWPLEAVDVPLRLDNC